MRAGGLTSGGRGARPATGRGAASRRDGLFLRAEALAAPLPPLLVAAERVAATVSQGVHGRRRVGQGETFWQFRRYESGDSALRIDWRQSAKSQHVYIRQTEWEAAQSVWLWHDSSRSMAYGSSRAWPTKLERAELLLLALASLLSRGGEHLALLGEGRAPAPGRAALRRLAATIEAGAEGGAGLPPVDPLPRYARVVLFGDFLAPLDQVKGVLSAYAAQGVRGHLLQILDPAEETLPFTGRVRFEGLEDEGDALIGRVEAVRETYRTTMAARHDALSALSRSVGWSYGQHHTDRPPQTALLSLFLALSDGSL